LQGTSLSSSIPLGSLSPHRPWQCARGALPGRHGPTRFLTLAGPRGAAATL